MIGLSRHPMNWIKKPRLFFLIQLLLFVIIFAMAFNIEYSHFMDNARETIKSNSETAEQLSYIVLVHHKSVIRILQSYSTRRSLIDAVRKKNFEAATVHLASMKKNNPEIDLTFITDRDGVLWVNYPYFPEAINKNLSYRDWYKGVSNRWQPYVSGVFQLIVGAKETAVAFAVPVFDEKGEVAGILSASLRTDVFAYDMQALMPDKMTKVTIIDQVGNIIYCNRLPYEKEVKKYLFSFSGDIIIANAPVKALMWTVVVEKKRGAILASLSSDFIHTAITASILYLLIGFALMFMRKHVVLQQAFALLASEEKLQESEEKYRSIFENIVEGIFQTTPEGHFISVNPAMARIHGFSSPEEMMTSITNIGEQLYLNPEDRKRYRAVLEEHRAVNGFEAQVYRKDGSIIWTSTSSHTVKDATGKVLHFEGTVEDITERRQAEEKLRKSLIGTIQVISLMLETRDPYTAGHQKRVSSLARSIAQEINLSNDTIGNIRMAGTIHDIGKLSVPAEILSKPTKLTDVEYSLIKVHPQTGYDILKDVELPSPIAKIVLQHHERLDGSGYPQGLKGEEIMLEARIIAVADVVEAIASNRPYRPARGIDAALDEIRKNQGVLYDSAATDACIRIFEEKRFSFE